MIPILSLEILKYIAEEVERQGDGPISVYDMARGWFDAMEMAQIIGGAPYPIPTLRDIERWGQLVAPRANGGGFRRGPVRVGSHIPRVWPLYLEDLDYLLKAIGATHIPPDLAYREFQEIHPFNDGNGRTGKIFFNYLNGTLQNPVMPPNFFNCSNP